MKFRAWLVFCPLVLALGGCGTPHASDADAPGKQVVVKATKKFKWGPPAPEPPVAPVTNPDFPEQPLAPLNPGNTTGQKNEDKIIPSTGAAQTVPK